MGYYNVSYQALKLSGERKMSELTENKEKYFRASIAIRNDR